MTHTAVHMRRNNNVPKILKTVDIKYKTKD